MKRVIMGQGAAFSGNENSGEGDFDSAANILRPYMNANETRLCSWTAPEGTTAPLVLTTDVISDGQVSFGGTCAGRGSIGGVSVETQFTAALVVRYGAGAVQSIREIDVRQGSYQLPPCTYAEVALKVWNENNAASPLGAAVAKMRAALTEGLLPLPSEATVSTFSTSQAAGSVLIADLARGARYWKYGSLNPAAEWLSNEPGGFAAVNTMSAFMGADPVTGGYTIYPPFQRRDIRSVSAGTFQLQNASVGAENFNLVQYIEF